MKIYLITGSAGFIGFHLSKNILSNKNTRVIGLDNINNYYSVNLKKSRLNILKKYKNFHFYKADISNNKKVRQIFANEKPEIVYNLAAQAGVRYSLQNPESYTKSNLLGFFNILDACKENKVKHFLFASTSSAYGNQNKMPIEESFNIDKPIQFYAATKSSNELMAYSYSDLYNMKITALRFFTVYGPWGRPDMALFKFTKNILSNKKIDVFNHGNHSRDFTYVDDCVEGIKLLTNRKSGKKFEAYNIANGNSKPLLKYIEIIEKTLGKRSKKNFLVLQKGDINKTFASIKKIKQACNFRPKIDIEHGIPNFINWYKDYYKIK